MLKMSNPQKRFTLPPITRLWLGVIMGAALGVMLLNGWVSLSFGQFGCDCSIVFLLICVILLLSSKEHSESVIIGYAIYSLYCIIINLNKITNILQLVFAAFIIFTLYVPIKPFIVKLVSLMYSAYLIYSSSLLLPFVSNCSTGFVEIISLCASMIAKLIIPITFVCSKYDDAEGSAFAEIETSIDSTLGIALSAGLAFVHLILFVITEAYLEGHTYGSPDKYGDYARGLYSSEVASLDSMIPALWFIVAILGAISIIRWKASEKSINGSGAINKSVTTIDVNTTKSTNKKFNDLTVDFTKVCVIGTIWAALGYGMYK